MMLINADVAVALRSKTICESGSESLEMEQRRTEVAQPQRRKARRKGTEKSRDAKRATVEPESETESTTGTAQLWQGMETGKQLPTTGTTERTTGKEKGNGEEQHEGEGSELQGAPNENGLRTPSEIRVHGPTCTEDQDYPESKDWMAFVHN
ncbi:hypothetical protein FQA39_LY05552 [Lamprigera yunnana]|nr:hypothetical protein FQA39_LY05552 [Lamprigera yunnana]